ncbi:sensor domain-containing protein [Synechococcus sp. BDU 130192]|uniref:sensor domain-containing protein n=1 Tax=Synechococcus sp. BDU 130192 TaxID=2042059 RepID=UPI000C0750B1|nr:EAL domain-containing protein [Synechococcus sp. BDU 130192]
MYQSLAALCAALMLTGIVYVLVKHDQKIAMRQQDYRYIIFGCILLALGRWLSFLQFSQYLAAQWQSLGTVWQFGERFISEGVGLIFVGVGLVRWLPTLTTFQRRASAYRQTSEALESERNILQGLFNSLQGALFVCDGAGNFIRWNRFYQEVLGFSDAEMSHLKAIETVVPEDREFVQQQLLEVFSQGYAEGEFRVRTKQGKTLRLYGFASRVELDLDQNASGFTGIAIDISALKQVEAELRRSQRSLQMHNCFLTLAHALTQRLHGSLEIEDIARETTTTLHQYYGETCIGFYLLEGATFEDGLLKLQSHAGFSSERRVALNQLTASHRLFRYALQDKTLQILDAAELACFCDDLSPQSVALSNAAKVLTIPLVFHEQQFGLLLMLFQEDKTLASYEIDTLRALGQSISLAIANAHHFKELRYQARYDSLTTIGNRNLFHDTIQEWLNAPSLGYELIIVMLIDLDRFKDLNDTLGHKLGNTFLQQIALRLLSALSPYQGIVCRLGGDEFAVACPMMHSEWEEACQHAVELADILQAAIQQPFVTAGNVIHITASLGIAMFPNHGTDSHAALRSAEVAMYAAKQKRTAYEIYHEDIDHYTPRRLAILSSLGKPSARQQFFLCYQPKFDLRQKRLIGVEALARWHHPTFGLISPAEFVPLAEQSDAIHALTYWIWEEAFQQKKAWQNQGLDLAIALNLSACSLLDPNCLTTFESLLQQYEIIPAQVELEITETALMSDPRYALELLQCFANLGVHLSIDDFGTGYSSLSYLQRFPVHALKIDQSFVVDMLTNEQSLVIVRSTINLAHSLGLEVVAEGVENQAILDLLKEMGCDIAQGYFLGRPQRAEQVHRFSAEGLKRVV